MNSYLIIINGNNKEFAVKEFETLFETYFDERIQLEHIEHTFYRLETNKDINNQDFLYRLTLTNFVIKNLGYYKNTEELKNNIGIIKQHENKVFRVSIKKSHKYIKTGYLEKEFAKPIWDSFDDPKVSLDDYEIEYDVLFVRKYEGFYFGIKLFENKKGFHDRMPKKRPIVMPYTLKSDMARACINLLKMKEGIVLDPFCGIGGILLEAYDCGLDVIGNDISYNDLKYLKINFEHYFPNSNYIRTLADSQTMFLKENTIDGIISDIPYGKCSRKLGEDLYESFLKNAKKMLKPNKRIVIVYANFCEFKNLALKYFDEVFEINEYINASMTRHILVLKNNK